MPRLENLQDGVQSREDKRQRLGDVLVLEVQHSVLSPER